MPWIGGARHVRWESPPIYMAFRVGGSCIFERGSPHRNVHRQSVIPVRTFRTASFGSKIHHALDQLEGNKIPIALDSGDAVSTRGLAIVAAPKSDDDSQRSIGHGRVPPRRCRGSWYPTCGYYHLDEVVVFQAYAGGLGT